MNQPTLFNIQKFSIHDGEGIRTTVFFKGCPLSCLWCHNPESQRFEKELMYYPERCTHCGACVQVCPHQAVSEDIVTDRTLCTACGRCTDVCLRMAREVVGYPIDLDPLIERIIADTPFYEVSGGGITLSGGEPMAQPIEFIEALCRRLSRRGYRVDIDTCGYAPYDRFQRILPFVDTFLFDIKHMDPEKHKQLTGVSNELILENIRRLRADGARISLRLPLIRGLNDDEQETAAVIDLAREISPVSIHLLPYHTAGSDKYERLGGQAAPGMQVPEPECLSRIEEQFRAAGFASVKIGG